MIDELLGRASLKARIDELEDENDRLQRRLEAESDRRSEAVTARQEAEERRNRLEDRIAQLEGELDRLDDGEGGGADLELRRRDRLRGRRLAEVIDRLESYRTGPEGALTATVDDTDGVPDPVAETLGDRAVLVEEAAPCLVCTDDEGVLSVALDGPLLPSMEAEWDDRFGLDRGWFLPSGRYALALVRADLFALGVYEGDERVAYRGFESDVKGNHSKGGFSQARFERIRNDQIDDHLDRCREAIADFEGERLYLAGQRGAVDALAEDVTADATVAVDATGDPKPALEKAFRSFWTTELHVV